MFAIRSSFGQQRCRVLELGHEPGQGGHFLPDRLLIMAAGDFKAADDPTVDGQWDLGSPPGGIVGAGVRGVSAGMVTFVQGGDVHVQTNALEIELAAAFDHVTPQLAPVE